MKAYYNVMEEIVPTLIHVMMYSPEYQTYCHCDQCLTDIIALTLNSLPPRYVTNDQTRDMIINLYKKDYMKKSLYKHIINSIHIVGKNPNHN